MPNSPTHEVVEQPTFTRQVAKLKLSDEEYNSILDVYAADPEYGEIVVGTGGLRKGRVAKEYEGKSGGYRVLSYFLDYSLPVFLIWIIDKSKDDSITDEQKNKFKMVLAAIKKEVRDG